MRALTMRHHPRHLLLDSRVLLGIVLVAVLVAAGGLTAYRSLSRTVTLSVDGHATRVHTFGGTVGDIFEARGLKPASHDVVVPAVDGVPRSLDRDLTTALNDYLIHRTD